MTTAPRTSLVRAYNEWDPLEEVFVGRAENAPDWTPIRNCRADTANSYGMKRPRMHWSDGSALIEVALVVGGKRDDDRKGLTHGVNSGLFTLPNVCTFRVGTLGLRDFPAGFCKCSQAKK